MTVKLLLLKSGEDVIADVQEMVRVNSETIEDVDSQQKIVLGYFLTKPCVVKLRDVRLNDENKSQKENSYNVTMYPWIPLTNDKVIPITAEWVITMVNPADKIKKMYEEDILSNEHINKNYSTNEQSDSDQSN